AALDGIVVGIDRLETRRLPGMRLDQQPTRVEPDDLRIGARGDTLADVRMRNRVERFIDGGELIAPHFRLAPERDVVRRRRLWQQQRLLLDVKVLEWPTLRATVPPEAVVVEAPVPAPRAGVVERGEHFPGEAVIACTGYGPFDTPFVPGMPDPRRVDVEVAGLCVFEKR